MVSRRLFLGGSAIAATGLLTGCGGGFGGGNGIVQHETRYRLPEESAPHLRTFMQWPSSLEVYEDPDDLVVMQGAIAKLARNIARFEPVVMLGAAEHAQQIAEMTGGAAEHWDIPTEDLWCRDAGPCFVQSENGRQHIMHFNFNGWGQNQLHKNDALVARKVAERLKIKLIDSGLVGEPGGFEYDGEGTIIAHESSWVNPDRNRIGKAAITARLEQATGARKVIWAPGLKGQDITDFHIDALARFVAPGRILIQLPKKADERDPFSISAWETYQILKNARDAEGRKFELIVLDEPERLRSDDEEMVASYANYYVCNGAVIAAEFGDDKADEAARSTLAELYPEREIVMLNVDPIGEAGGGIHCATQQQPKNLI